MVEQLQNIYVQTDLHRVNKSVRETWANNSAISVNIEICILKMVIAIDTEFIDYLFVFKRMQYLLQCDQKWTLFHVVNLISNVSNLVGLFLAPKKPSQCDLIIING